MIRFQLFCCCCVCVLFFFLLVLHIFIIYPLQFFIHASIDGYLSHFQFGVFKEKETCLLEYMSWNGHMSLFLLGKCIGWIYKWLDHMVGAFHF